MDDQLKPNHVQIDVLFFAKSREISGVKQTKIEFPIKTTAQDILKNILYFCPRLGVIQNNCILTLNEDYLEGDKEVILKPRDEIAVIPPISGG